MKWGKKRDKITDEKKKIQTPSPGSMNSCYRGTFWIKLLSTWQLQQTDAAQHNAV